MIYLGLIFRKGETSWNSGRVKGKNIKIREGYLLFHAPNTFSEIHLTATPVAVVVMSVVKETNNCFT